MVQDDELVLLCELGEVFEGFGAGVTPGVHRDLAFGEVEFVLEAALKQKELLVSDFLDEQSLFVYSVVLIIVVDWREALRLSFGEGGLVDRAGFGGGNEGFVGVFSADFEVFFDSFASFVVFAGGVVFLVHVLGLHKFIFAINWV